MDILKCFFFYFGNVALIMSNRYSVCGSMHKNKENKHLII